MARAIPLFLAVVCTVPALRADALADLTSRLRALKAQTPVTLKIVQTSTEWDEGKARQEVRTLRAAEGPEGLRVLEDSGAGRPAGTSKDPTAQKGRSTWSRQFRGHEDLLEELGKARLVGEAADTLEGRSVRRLRLALDLDLDESARKHLKRAVMEATLWLGGDGLPVAMERHLDLDVRAMVFVKVWTKVDSRYRFLRVQDRLLTVEATDEVSGEAMGHPFRTQVHTQATLQP